MPEIFALLRTFAPQNSQKDRLRNRKNPQTTGPRRRGSVHPEKFRPNAFRLHGSKFFPAKNFRPESWYRRIVFAGKAGFFPARNLKNQKIYRLKVEKSQKKLARKLKKDGSSTTNSLHRRESQDMAMKWSCWRGSVLLYNFGDNPADIGHGFAEYAKHMEDFAALQAPTVQ